MPNLVLNYGTATNMPMSATTAANGVTVSHTNPVSNTTNQYQDYIIMVQATTAAAATAGRIDLYIRGSWDGVPTLYDTVGLNDSPFSYYKLGSIRCNTNSVAVSKSISVAAPYNGACPAHFFILLHNQTGATITSISMAHTGIFFSI